MIRDSGIGMFYGMTPVAVFVCHEAHGGRNGVRDWDADQASHETPTPTSCRRNLHVPSLPALSTARSSSSAGNSLCAAGSRAVWPESQYFGTLLRRFPWGWSSELPSFPPPSHFPLIHRYYGLPSCINPRLSVPLLTVYSFEMLFFFLSSSQIWENERLVRDGKERLRQEKDVANEFESRSDSDTCKSCEFRSVSRPVRIRLSLFSRGNLSRKDGVARRNSWRRGRTGGRTR